MFAVVTKVQWMNAASFKVSCVLASHRNPGPRLGNLSFWMLLWCCHSERSLTLACQLQESFFVLNNSRPTGCVLPVLQIWMCGRDGCGGQRKHMALCVAGSDMSGLSIDWDICLGELVRIHNGAVVVLQGSLESFVLFSTTVIKHVCMLTDNFTQWKNLLFSSLVYFWLL